MTPTDYLKLSRQIIEALPKQFQEKAASIEILVQDWPTAEELASSGLSQDEGLYGLFIGRAETERGFGDEDPLPDRIILYRGPLEEDFPDMNERKEEIRKTLLHEIGHFFGLSEEEIETLGYG